MDRGRCSGFVQDLMGLIPGTAMPTQNSGLSLDLFMCSGWSVSRSQGGWTDGPTLSHPSVLAKVGLLCQVTVLWELLLGFVRRPQPSQGEGNPPLGSKLVCLQDITQRQFCKSRWEALLSLSLPWLTVLRRSHHNSLAVISPPAPLHFFSQLPH